MVESSALMTLIVPVVRGMLGGFAVGLFLLGLLAVIDGLVSIWPRRSPEFDRMELPRGREQGPWSNRILGERPV